ncbi:LacI family DNA-binding transcriptional regulator [Devosia sp. Root635]|uniref:LacI family DNA-binding transcriptional regulator n=1 Tax=Devosia sp. Root635 TaxID=1736575 RepID=UPI0006F51AC0|nr:LacI family DNA-binding transcriptional regulator [Devosia sp. Root635]KRA55870.1 transcriptional regulator [Devosia sp. Root635]
MGRPITRLKDIADSTGFSVNTVSLALRDSPRIPEETRLTIRQAAEALNYLPNHIAKSLVSRETKTVGLVLTSITNPVLTRVAQAIELRLAERGYSTLFATSNGDPEAQKTVIEMFRSRQVDGMLIYPCSHRDLDHVRRVRQAGHPVVLLVGDPDAGVDVVSMDTRRGGYKAVRHLLELGHRRIGLVDGGHERGNLEKADGYRQALAEAGLAADERLQATPRVHSVAAGYAAMADLMARGTGMTALLAATDSLALGALRWSQENGLRVPQDMAIVGFDNIEFAEYAATPISSVDYAVDAVTELAVDRLIGLIGADALPEPEVTLIEPELVLRASSGGSSPLPRRER